ncbi:MAG: hypothetical protein NC236_02215 [Mycoplasma sp.]|nr:hypothetical protein [Mycoplasma sp.]
METRVEKWKKYREEIKSDNDLSEMVRRSNEQFTILYKRLMKVHKNFKFKPDNPKKIKLIKQNEFKNFSIPEIDELTKEINDYYEKFSKYDFEYSGDFSTNRLDDVIENMNKKIIKKENSFNKTTKQNEIEITEMKSFEFEDKIDE